VDRDAVEEHLSRSVARAPGTKIQYGHPSPRFWRGSDADLPELLAALTPGRDLALYLHIPFCVPTDPGGCGFCLFAREDFSSHAIAKRYVASLIRELERVSSLVGRRELGAVYFGGGTPNLLNPPEIRALFDAVSACFVVTEATEITFEGYPPLFSLERLETLADVGCTRLSLGVQTLDPAMLEESGRTQDALQLQRTLRFAADHGQACSVDLITGWFGQTPGSIVRDVETLLDWGATGVVNHPLVIGGDSAFTQRADQLPDVTSQAETFEAARQAMLGRGLRMDSYTDYRVPNLPPVRYLEMYRDVLGADRIGVGYGANSLLAGTQEHPGRTWVNMRSTGEYQSRVDAGLGVVDGRFDFTAEDLRLLYILKGLEGTPWLDAAEYAARFGGDLRQDYEPFWAAFEARGWLGWTPSGPRLQGEGIYRTATAQRCLAEPRNRQLRARAASGESGPRRADLPQ
jgi:oxygen-independent coproporphyrinogen-3 oxidase